MDLQQDGALGFVCGERNGDHLLAETQPHLLALQPDGQRGAEVDRKDTSQSRPEILVAESGADPVSRFLLLSCCSTADQEQTDGRKTAALRAEDSNGT